MNTSHLPFRTDYLCWISLAAAILLTVLTNIAFGAGAVALIFLFSIVVRRVRRRAFRLR